MRINPNFNVQKTSSGGVILNKANGDYWEINQNNVFLIENLVKEIPLEHIAAEIANQCDGDFREVRDDLAEMQSQLMQLGLLSDD